MKKKTLYNLIMVLIIVCIVGGGVLGVGHIRGWFDRADGGAVLQNVVGVVRMERAGVNYPVESDTVLRVGDVIRAQSGATAVIAVGDDRITLGGGAELTVVQTDALELSISAGELFIDVTGQTTICFEADKGSARRARSAARAEETATETVRLTISDATVNFSYRSGAQTVRVLRGAVDDVPAGKEKEYVSGTTMISDIQIESLNTFVITQIRSSEREEELCITGTQLDELEEKRRQELEDLINGSTDDKPTHTHQYTPEVIAPTCTEGGYTRYTCECGDSYRDNETAAVGHSFGAWEVTQAATTQSEGRMERVCRTCRWTEEKTLDKLSETHTHSYTVEVIAPTCTEEGYTLYVCACGNRYKDTPTPALGHSYTANVIAPTCTAQGYTEYVCACGDRYADDFVNANGHTWGEWEPTGENAFVRTCGVCGETQTKTEEKPPVHEHEYKVTIVAATCTQDGYTEHKCDCGDSYRDNETASKGHAFGAWETVKEATEQEEGLLVRLCKNCSEKEEQIVGKLEHVHVYTQETVKPTCTDGGYTLHTCSCGDSYRDSETEKLGHDYAANVVKPTCTVAGYTQYTCTRCGDSYVADSVTALEHDWGAWVTVREPTTSEEGLKKRTCHTCGEEQESTIDKLDGKMYAYISIRCDTILDNWDNLTPGKAEFVPGNGTILPMIRVAFSEGDTVFDVLCAVCEQMDIQIEFSWTPLYKSYYIEGINNLYEFDCGTQSGWMYRVNGWFPNYGCSSYYLEDGDVIEWLYTCNGLGEDVGAPPFEE